MLKLEVDVEVVKAGDTGTATIYIEKKRGETWHREETIVVEPGAKDSARTLLVENDQRIVIEGWSETTMVYDREQMANVPRTVPRPTGGIHD